MARKKRELIGRTPPVDWEKDNPDHVAFWEYYQDLTSKGKASEWIRETLIAAMPARTRMATHAPTDVRKAGFRNVRVGFQDEADGELSYEDPE